MNILYVCTGNTCRSPMAEGITRTLATELGLDVIFLAMNQDLLQWSLSIQQI